MPRAFERISSIQKILKARSYLEIGVYRGDTFNKLDFPKKVAVDPHFQFDIREYKKENIEFNQIKSDDFFLGLSSEIKFDIIFLDGLHTYDQTYKDFCNSIQHSHDKTIIIIDDTIPIDRFSTLRDWGESARLRAKEGNKNLDFKGWHGDVFKILLLIKVFHPKWHFATIANK